MVQVKISDGVLEGEQFGNKYGGTIYSFKGIPYAEPPIGDLRFKAPVKIKAWNGIREAKQFGHSCPQYNIFSKEFHPGNEDCLYLNVYSPDLTPPKPLPVMFWIHGGAFVCGSADIYRPDFLLQHDVLLVTINYRLEVLGFLCLHSEDVPGNAGMKDQVEAMRWVQRNIANFGGDPNNVTIFGESAGGASVSYHLISPMTKGLFRRAIIQSGTCANYWTQNSMPRERAMVLASNLGLESEDNSELYEFFKSQPVELLVNAHVSLTFFESYKVGYDNIKFSVVDEKYFETNERYYYGDVLQNIRLGIHEGVEVINGYNEHEGLLMVVNKDNRTEILKQANSFPEFYVPNSILLKCTVPQVLYFGRKLKKFYFAKDKVSIHNILQLIKFYTVLSFVYEIILWQKLCASSSRNKCYLYKFTCKSERNTKAKDILGSASLTSHGDDVAYLFPIKKDDQKIVINSKAFKMINTITKMWTNFAKYGKPTPDDALGEKWLPYTLEKRNFLDIGEHLTLGEDPDGEDIEFCMDLFKDFHSKV